MRCKTTRNSATILVILINVLLKDGQLGPKHIVNKSPLHKINNPYLYQTASSLRLMNGAIALKGPLFPKKTGFIFRTYK
jgi:hypothetical protein